MEDLIPIFCYDEDLELVKFEGDVVASSFYHLDTHEDSLLLSVGLKDAVMFDGEGWIRVLQAIWF